MATATLGVTGPLSSALPTPDELEKTNTLVEELKAQKLFESDAETNKRSKVLESLQNVADEFVKHVCRAQNKGAHFIKNARAKIMPFGSFKLGVIGPGSDIDTLVVTPNYVTKVDFFTVLPELLYKMVPEGAITEFTPKPDAFAPCITFKYSDIDIDLLFGRIDSLAQIPKDFDLRDDELLRGLDPSEVVCVNGVRVATETLQLVPEASVFRTALRVIKLWSARRAISGNMYGFPGGVVWALLVARVCQLYPKATASVVVLKFFRIMEKWQWPMPVMLKNMDTHPGLNHKIWNPKHYPSDRNHIMPVITPAYPSMCATHNFTRATQTILLNEFIRGGQIADQIMLGKVPWKDLFVKHTFFTAGYKYYLAVISASTTSEAQLPWSGLVESKVRLLVGKLLDHPSIQLAHPFNKGFNRVHRCRTDAEIEAVKTGSLEYYAKDVGTATSGHGLAAGAVVAENTVNGDSKVANDENNTMVYTTTNYIGLELFEGAKSLDLSWQVDEFKRICQGWEKYNPELSALHIDHIRSFQLPDDVFGEGEVKPSRPNKRKAATTNGSMKKRAASGDVNAASAKRKQQTSAVAAS